MALGEGSEMLQPLAVTLISGLSFSTFVTLLLIPSVYRLIGR
ncbi:MAG: efflux RND transporter permease subunit [Candidatus Thiodiazotropha sp.]